MNALDARTDHAPTVTYRYNYLKDNPNPDSFLDRGHNLRIRLIKIIVVLLIITGIPALSFADDRTKIPFEPDDTIADIQTKIKENGYSFSVERNWVFDLDKNDKKTIFSRSKGMISPRYIEETDPGPLAAAPCNRALPESFDWRDHNGRTYIGEIRNQGGCGSCYSFSASAAAEGTYNIATGNYNDACADFSESFIIWCLGSLPEYNGHFYGCDGADYGYYELDALVNDGICPETDFPYTTNEPESCSHWEDTTVCFDSWHRISCGDIDAIKTAIMNYGVIDAAVYAGNAFQAYSSGIYEDTNTSCDASPCYYAQTNHAIALVGWDDNNGEGYWILRNSWGTSWGEDGYMRIRYTSAHVACAAAYLVYTPPDIEEKPSAATGNADNLTITSAVLTGTVIPNGLTTQYFFEYGTNTLYGSTTAVKDAGSDYTETDVSNTVYSLHGLTTYHYRLVATNGLGTTYGDDMILITTGTPTAPSVDTRSADKVTIDSACLNGVVNSHGSPTTYYFEYGQDTDYEYTTALLSTATSTEDTLIDETISGLIPQTTYHYRIAAANDMGTNYGQDSTFSTSDILVYQPAGSVNTNGYISVRRNSADDTFIADDIVCEHPWTIKSIAVYGELVDEKPKNLNFRIYGNDVSIPDGDPTGQGSAALWSACLSPEDSQITMPVSASVINSIALTPESPVHLDPGTYWLTFFPETITNLFYWKVSDTTNNSHAHVVDPDQGITQWSPVTDIGAYGLDQQDFALIITGKVSIAPDANTGRAEYVKWNNATLTGMINPHGYPTTYILEYGPTTSYGSNTTTADAGQGMGRSNISASVNSLLPDTLYHYRISATSSCGTSHGQDMSFTTQPQKYIVTASPCTGGNITPAGTSVLDPGDSVTCSITPHRYCYIYDVVVDGISQGVISSYTFSDIQSNHNITAIFAAYQANIVSSAGFHGSILPKGTIAADCGQDVTFTITPDDHYHISDVLIDGISIGAQSPYTFSVIQADHTISAIFAIDTCTLNIETTGSGLISLSTSNPENVYVYGTEITIEAIPEAGYTFSGWQGDLSGSANPASICMDDDRSVAAVFTEDTGNSVTPNAPNNENDQHEQTDSGGSGSGGCFMSTAL